MKYRLLILSPVDGMPEPGLSFLVKFLHTAHTLAGRAFPGLSYTITEIQA